MSVERKGQVLPGEVGMRLEASDTLKTGADGAVGITMRDNSLLSAGPNSILSLERFDFDATTSQGRFDAQLQRGTLAVVSGRIAKQSPQAMTVRTPSAQLGVRGTDFVVSAVNRAWRAVAACLLAALLGACATPQGTVVLLPDKDGKDTARHGQAGRQGTAARQALCRGPVSPAAARGRPTSSAEQVQAQFGAALAARPLPPAQFTLYFVEGKDEFTDESKRAFDSVFAEIAKRPVPDVLVIGHTDTVGTDVFNDALSRQRAEVVRRALVARGIAAENMVRRRPRQARADRAHRRRRGRGAQPARRDPGALGACPALGRASRGGPRRAVPAQRQDRQVVGRFRTGGKGHHVGPQRFDQPPSRRPRRAAVAAATRCRRSLPYSAPAAVCASFTPSVIRHSISPRQQAAARSRGSRSRARRTAVGRRHRRCAAARRSEACSRYGLSCPALQ